MNTRSCLCVFCMLIVSCSVQETNDIDMHISRNSFYASIEIPIETETKVFVDQDLRVLWDKNDHVSIFDKYTFNQEYRFTGNTGDNAGSFQIIESDDFVTGNTLDLVYSVYPYSKENRIDNDGVLSVFLPDHQAYREDSFGLGANTMVSCTTGNELMFKNLCGFLMLRLYGDDVSVSSLTIKGNEGESLAGQALVYSSPDGVPSLSFKSSPVREISVTMESPVRLGSSAASATAFWIVIPPICFNSGFTLSVVDEKGLTFEKSTSKTIRIERNTLSRMAALALEDGEERNIYIDEYGVNQGPGITIDGITWAPVNCGYKPATADSKGYPYGKLYQYGRKNGQGYGAPYFNSSDTFEDESVPTLASQWTGNNEDADANTFYYSGSEPYNWISSNEQFWNDGSESEPRKNVLYDPCPAGWRVPTITELSKLANGYHSDIVDVNGILGIWHSGSNVYDEGLSEKVFFPACGARFADNWYHHNGAVGRGSGGNYWSSSLDGNYAMNMGLSGDVGSTYKAFGYAVRCCKDEIPSSSPISVSSISLDKTTLTLSQGDSETLHATVLPANATDKTVTWTSSNTAVASVSNGTVTAIAPGSATITASAGNETATCEVTVVEASIESLIKVYFSGVDISSGGSMMYEDPYWVFTAGAKLSITISNTSSKEITITGFCLICGKTNQQYRYSINEKTIEGGQGVRYTVTIPSTVYSPIAEFTYLYENETLTASAQYN